MSAQRPTSFGLRCLFVPLGRISRAGSLRLGLFGAAMAGVVALLPNDAARAACILVGTTETCTGDISGGASFTAPTVLTLNANTLTNNIVPPSGTRGLEL